MIVAEKNDKKKWAYVSITKSNQPGLTSIALGSSLTLIRGGGRPGRGRFKSVTFTA